MFAGAFFGHQYFGVNYFGDSNVVQPVSPYWGPSYFGGSFFGDNYFGHSTGASVTASVTATISIFAQPAKVFTPTVVTPINVSAQAVAPTDHYASSLPSVGLAAAINVSKFSAPQPSATVGFSDHPYSVADYREALPTSVGFSDSIVAFPYGTAAPFGWVGFSGSPASSVDRPASASVSVGLSPSGVGYPGSGIATTVLSISPAVANTADRLSVPVAVAAFSPSASAILDSASSPYLGRFRRGDTVVFSLSLKSTPDSAPVATAYGPTGNEVASLPLFTKNGLDFAAPMLIGPFELGTFSVSITYSIAGSPENSSKTFDVVPGGDSGGDVISLFLHSRPESKYVIAQLSSGKVVQGRNPHL